MTIYGLINLSTNKVTNAIKTVGTGVIANGSSDLFKNQGKNLIPWNYGNNNSSNGNSNSNGNNNESSEK